MSIPKHTTQSVLALVLVAFAFTMSAILSRSVFERLPHLEDEVAYLFQARTYAGGDLVVPTPEPRRAYWQPFVVDHEGQRFSKYAPGWPLLLTVGVLLGQPWLINALLAALAVALTYRLGREVFDADTGLIAAALVAFSPMALLLNASLMGHTAALCFAVLFVYAYWRLERALIPRQSSSEGPLPHGEGLRAMSSRGDECPPKRVRANPLPWALLAGLALGMILINRPLTAAGLSLPFVAWSGLRLLRDRRRLLAGDLSTLTPLLALAGVTLLIGLAIPIYNTAATGDPTQNLYTLVWSYDTIGFGECCGRNGHTLEKGFRHLRFDLSLAAADFFGWQAGPFISDSPDLQTHLLQNSDYWPALGLSWLLLPFGLLVGLWRQRWLLLVWLAAGFVILNVTVNHLPPETLRDPAFAWGWMLLWFGWILALGLWLAFRAEQRAIWTWLVAAVALSIISAQMTYWIGSQRYSTRYFFEALPALALLSALPLSWLIRRTGQRWLVYAGVSLVLVFSLLTYSLPRISVLHGFNFISQARIDAVLERRAGDAPVLVLITGDDVRWRAAGPYMAVTSPRLDSDIVVALDNTQPGIREQILARFPDRQVIEMEAEGNNAWFVDER